MTSEQRKQVRRWIVEEYELLKAQYTDTEAPFCDHQGAFRVLKEALVDRLVDKYGDQISDRDHYDDLRQIIHDWWLENATPEELRQYASFHRSFAERADTAAEARDSIIANAIALEKLARAREIVGPESNPNN